MFPLSRGLRLQILLLMAEDVIEIELWARSSRAGCAVCIWMYNPHMSPRPEGDVPTLLRKGRELLQEYEDESACRFCC
jgi:hypothetical protein